MISDDNSIVPFITETWHVLGEVYTSITRIVMKAVGYQHNLVIETL